MGSRPSAAGFEEGRLVFGLNPAYVYAAWSQARMSFDSLDPLYSLWRFFHLTSGGFEIHSPHWQGIIDVNVSPRMAEG